MSFEKLDLLFMGIHCPREYMDLGPLGYIQDSYPSSQVSILGEKHRSDEKLKRIYIGWACSTDSLHCYFA